MNTKNTAWNIFEFIQNIFLNGLLVILPIAITIGVFTYTFRLFKNWLAPIYLHEPEFLQRIPHSEFLLAIIFIFIIGAIFKTFFLSSLLHWIENTFFKIPLMQPLYFGVKQLVQAFTSKDKLTFKHVVLVEFPRPGIYSIGFLTSEAPESLFPETATKYLNVFVPTTPNPTSGFLIMVAEHECRIIDLTRQEAMSLIISGGIIQPNRLFNKN
jgi:uncharacterized membrane protein